MDTPNTFRDILNQDIILELESQRETEFCTSLVARWYRATHYPAIVHLSENVSSQLHFHVVEQSEILGRQLDALACRRLERLLYRRHQTSVSTRPGAEAAKARARESDARGTHGRGSCPGLRRSERNGRRPEASGVGIAL